MARNWSREKKQEGWYRKAKREGYRARSAFKLQQIQERFNVVRPGDTVIDLGAAPGGWTQVAVELAAPNGRVVGIDLQPIRPLPGATFLQGDLTRPETVAAALRVLTADARGVRVDVVLCDMSPNITGNYTMDQANSVWLCQHALSFARQVLDAGGRLVMKVFEGEDYPGLVAEIEGSFHRVKPYNPPASRKQSSEIYLIATGFKPPPTRRTPGTTASAAGPPSS